MDNIIPGIAVGLLIFIVLREVMCWYWRIHERVNNQEKQIELLEKILLQISQINIKIDPDIEIVYEDEVEDEVENETEEQESTP